VHISKPQQSSDDIRIRNGKFHQGDGIVFCVLCVVAGGFVAPLLAGTV
jgi:hypothetical protein